LASRWRIETASSRTCARADCSSSPSTGVDVLSAKLGGGYVRFSGTSMATPHVAAAAALLWGAHRRSSPKTIRTLLDAHTTDTGAPGRDPVFGFGVLDLAR